MNIILNILQVLQVVCALVMIGLILMQQGKGATAGATFGGGASGSLFGASGNATFLSRTTAILATIFFVCTLVLAYYGNRGNAGDSSILSRLPAAESAASGPASAVATPASAASATQIGANASSPVK